MCKFRLGGCFRIVKLTFYSLCTNQRLKDPFDEFRGLQAFELLSAIISIFHNMAVVFSTSFKCLAAFVRDRSFASS